MVALRERNAGDRRNQHQGQGNCSLHAILRRLHTACPLRAAIRSITESKNAGRCNWPKGNTAAEFMSRLCVSMCRSAFCLYHCFGSLALITARSRDVRFTPESGHVRCDLRCRLWANSGHFQSRETASRQSLRKGLSDAFKPANRGTQTAPCKNRG